MYTTEEERGNSARPAPAQLHLQRAPKLGNMTIRFLSPVIGLLTHRPKAADQPCPGATDCPAAVHRGKSRWKGYAACYAWRDRPFCDWIPAVVEVTEKLDALLDYQKIVGQSWEIWREPGESGHIEVTGKLLDYCAVPPVPAMEWIEPVLRKVYRVSALFLGVPNPFRSVILLPPVKMPPPPNALPPAEVVQAAAAQETANVRSLLQKARAEGRL